MNLRQNEPPTGRFKATAVAQASPQPDVELPPDSLEGRLVAIGNRIPLQSLRKLHSERALEITEVRSGKPNGSRTR